MGIPLEGGMRIIARTTGFDSDLLRFSRDLNMPSRSKAMPMNKPHLEFLRVDMTEGWATPPGYPTGIKQKILASDLDETGKMGSRTRLLRFDPGVYTTAPFVHDHWEEVYLMSGDLIVGNDTSGKGGEPFEAPTYACRPPGVYHGPFKSERGCMLFEIHYYDESKKS
jgi:ChrR-like protein with cupin domain